jgi:hypothetical protein
MPPGGAGEPWVVLALSGLVILGKVECRRRPAAEHAANLAWLVPVIARATAGIRFRRRPAASLNAARILRANDRVNVVTRERFLLRATVRSGVLSPRKQSSPKVKNQPSSPH